MNEKKHTCKECGHFYNEKWGLGMCFRHDDMTVSRYRVACSWFQTEFKADRTRMCDDEVSADEIEPKFHEGDFVVSKITNTTYQIESVVLNVTNNKYGYDLTNGGYIASIEAYKYHLWTIEDAKDGDVLYSLDSKQPFIFKHRKPNEQAEAYCGLNIYGKFFVWGTKDCVITLSNYIPATKEQRDTLFKAMTEKGYEWDAEKKELKKIHVIDEGKAEMDYCFTKMMAGEIGQHENGKWFGWIDFGEEYYETDPYKERSSAESELLGFFNGVDIKISIAIKELKQRLEDMNWDEGK